MKKIIIILLPILITGCCSLQEREDDVIKDRACSVIEKVIAEGKEQFERVIIEDGQEYIIKKGSRYISTNFGESGLRIFDVIIDEITNTGSTNE